MHGPIPILVVMTPGRWRDSLLVLLRASERVAIAAVAGDGSDGWQCIRALAPAAVFLDAGLPAHQAQELLQRIAQDSPSTCCLVLAQTHEQACLAAAAGAQVIDIGFSAESLFQILDSLEHTDDQTNTSAHLPLPR